MANSRPVQRIDADRHWLLMVTSFGVSVVGTRVYLEAAGYPQIGNGTLHIAHVLWGGLLLFVALAIFLTFGNRWSYSLGAITGGAGVGLFIDEVGKFITQSNDYFFPFAAPIIYGFFLLTVLIYLQLRRLRPHDTRADLYWVLDQLKDVIDQDFDVRERARVEAVLLDVTTQRHQPEQQQMAEALLKVVRTMPTIKPPEPNLFQRLEARLRDAEQRLISQGVHRTFLIVAFVALSLSGLAMILSLISVGTNLEMRDQFFTSAVEESFFQTQASLQWLLVHSVLTVAMGTLYLIAAGLLFLRRDASGIRIGRLALILELTVVNVLAFYFNQFTMIFSTLAALVVLLAVERYRSRFLDIAEA
jgi:hypothetical protein